MTIKSHIKPLDVITPKPPINYPVLMETKDKSTIILAFNPKEGVIVISDNDTSKLCTPIRDFNIEDFEVCPNYFSVVIQNNNQ